MSSSNPAVQSSKPGLPALPLTIEGHSVLHQMLRVKWPELNKLDAGRRAALAQELSGWLAPLEQEGRSALFSMLGHKGDLMLVHFRDSFDELKAAELQLNRLQIQDYLEPAHSYLSVIELGLYESTVKLYRQLSEQGIAPNTPQWNQEVEQMMARQREAMKPRLLPKIPGARYLCFYPMDRKRGEDKNWYMLPIEERQRQMDEHGAVGRRYAGKVQQIITGSIGFDDWEWGVDLFSDDSMVFKKLIYEMRFDQVSAEYALFGQFFVGVRVASEHVPALFEGKLSSKA
jgi:hydrogen peroxide-dependent heme synthase